MSLSILSDFVSKAAEIGLITAEEANETLEEGPMAAMALHVTVEEKSQHDPRVIPLYLTSFIEFSGFHGSDVEPHILATCKLCSFWRYIL